MEATFLLALQALRLPFLTQLAALVSALGNYAFVWIVLAIVLVLMGRQQVGIPIIISVLITGILVGFILQPAFGHVRPCDANIGVSAVMGVSRSGCSFPSFHAATSFAAAMAIAMAMGRKGGMWAFAGAILIAMSRMYLGVEYPIDVIVGAIIGIVMGIVATWVYNQFLHDYFRDLFINAGRTRGKRPSVSRRR